MQAEKQQDSVNIVLVIDDDVANRRVIERVLKDASFLPMTAKDGKTGLSMARRRKPDLILLDVIMPRENGFEILEHIKNDPELESIPVIMFTILENAESREKALEMGARDYITKPFDMERIVDCIRRYL